MRTDKIGVIFVKILAIVCTMANCVDMPKMTVIPFQTKPQQPKHNNFRFCSWTLAITRLSRIEKVM